MRQRDGQVARQGDSQRARQPDCKVEGWQDTRQWDGIYKVVGWEMRGSQIARQWDCQIARWSDCKVAGGGMGDMRQPDSKMAGDMARQQGGKVAGW